MDSRFAGKKILLLDGLTSQCLEYTKAFNGLGCDTTVLCDDRLILVMHRSTLSIRFSVCRMSVT